MHDEETCRDLGEQYQHIACGRNEGSLVRAHVSLTGWIHLHAGTRKVARASREIFLENEATPLTRRIVIENLSESASNDRKREREVRSHRDAFSFGELQRSHVMIGVRLNRSHGYRIGEFYSRRVIETKPCFQALAYL